MPSYDGVIGKVDFVNKRIRTPDLERGGGAVGKASKDDLLEKIERGEKILVNNATVQLMRKKLPKLRLHYNTIDWILW